MYLFAGPAAKDIIGWRAEELIGRTPYSIMPYEDVALVSRYHDDRLAGQWEGAWVYARAIGRDHVIRWVRFQIEWRDHPKFGRAIYAVTEPCAPMQRAFIGDEATAVLVRL